MFHKAVQLIDVINTFMLLPMALMAIKAFFTKKSLTPKLDRFFIELFWIQMVIGFVAGIFLYHHHFVDACGAIYLTAWRILENWYRIHPYIPSAEDLKKKEAAELRKRAEKEADEVTRQVVPQMKRKKGDVSTSISVLYPRAISDEALAILQARFAEKGWSLTVDHSLGNPFVELRMKKAKS